jgi:hypothetical protein
MFSPKKSRPKGRLAHRAAITECERLRRLLLRLGLLHARNRCLVLLSTEVHVLLTALQFLGVPVSGRSDVDQMLVLRVVHLLPVTVHMSGSVDLAPTSASASALSASALALRAFSWLSS